VRREGLTAPTVGDGAAPDQQVVHRSLLKNIPICLRRRRRIFKPGTGAIRCIAGAVSPRYRTLGASSLSPRRKIRQRAP
ncbi:hypothetical protein ACQJ02_29785, partial [Pseudomonas zeae]|uniref:hypothetical protein n=1 Tax=Pseudomonas zeae TaxID=2745510 RepID=UPI003D04724E